MTADKPPIDLVAMRRRVAEMYNLSIGMAAQHLAAAEALASSTRIPDDGRVFPGGDRGDMVQGHLRFAEVYALLGRACQKVPGSQF